MNSIAAALIFLTFCAYTETKLTCKDLNGKPVDHGQEYMPDADDRCKTCLCDKGFPTMCRLVSCSPPACPHWKQVKTECCSFKCIDTFPDPTITPANNNTDKTVTSADSLTTLGLRLVASTVTSFLVLALLLFAVHQLRRKRLILAMRRYSDNRRRHNHDMYTPDYFGMACPPYEEPPPPYSPPKPPVHPEEAPPPYDSVDTNHNVSSRVYPEQNYSPQGQSNESSAGENSSFSNRAAVIQTIDRNLRARQLSGGGYSHWNTLPHRGDNQRNERGLSGDSDFESDFASTDFAITSDSESHCGRRNVQENVDLRQLRLKKLLSPNRTVNNSNISTSNNLEGHQPRSSCDNLQSDDQYPEHNLSQNLTQSPGYRENGSVATETRNNQICSPLKCNVGNSEVDCSVV